MSLLIPGKAQSQRRYVDGGVRGLSEPSLRIVRGDISTTSPTILAGEGFTVAKSGTGDVTITFARAFAEPPTVVAMGEFDGVPNTRVVQKRGRPTETSVRLVLHSAATPQDGIISFVAYGVR